MWAAPTQTLTVAAAPDVAQVLNTIARQWKRDRARPAQGRCVAASVVSKEIQPGGPVRWAPNWDSGSRRGAAAGRGYPSRACGLLGRRLRGPRRGRPCCPRDPVSIAASPVVLAVRQPMMQALGWPQTTLGWNEVLGAFGAAPTLWAEGGGTRSGAALKVGLTQPRPHLDTGARLGAGGCSDQSGNRVRFSDGANWWPASASTPDHRARWPNDNHGVLQGAGPGRPRRVPDSIVAAFPHAGAGPSRAYKRGPARPRPMVTDLRTAEPRWWRNFPYTVLNAAWVDSVAHARRTTVPALPAHPRRTGVALARKGACAPPDRSVPGHRRAAGEPGFSAPRVAGAAGPTPERG